MDVKAYASRGNFKMNGSIKMITEIIDQINDAKLDDQAGRFSLSSCDYHNSGTTIFNDYFSRSSDINVEIKLTPPEIVVAPPALYLLKVQETLKAPTQVSAQNCFTETSGAYTGEISPSQLKDANVHWVILGHSERRALFGEADKVVADKVRAALKSGLAVIACIGEKLEERENGTTDEVVQRQLEAVAKEIDESKWK
jgi:triosephosphate isomerase